MVKCTVLVGRDMGVLFEGVDVTLVMVGVDVEVVVDSVDGGRFVVFRYCCV